VPNSAAGTACMDSRCLLPPLDMPDASVAEIAM
jgi:hypothetical protein